MRISDRIEETIERWRIKWQATLKEWMSSWLAWGIELLMNVIGKAFAPKLKPLIDSIEETGEVPSELQPLLSEMKTPTGQIAAILGWTTGGAIVGGAIGKITDALFLRFGYSMMSKFHPLILDEARYLALWRRGDIKADELQPYLRKLGFDDDAVLHLQKLSEIRLDPGTITRIWLRDKAKYEELWKDLYDQGFDPDRIEIMKELAKIIPPLADMVRFADFSAFDPTVIEQWREFYDAPGWIREPFSLLGVEEDWANKYWFSHWIQPGRFELGEMHRRGLIDDATVKLAYRTMGYSPFWQDLLLELVKAVPTRVDVRRWWDMRTIDEARLREIYHAQGYYDKDLDDYVLWTKVYVTFPDLIARYKNGWITEADVKSELIAIGMPADRAEEMWQTKFKKATPERVAKERDLTKTEIVKGVKKEVISYLEGIELLMDMGYDEAEATFILQINVGVLEGSPESYTEFKQWTQIYRKAQGLEAKIPPAELQEAEKALIEAEAELKAKIVEGMKEEKLLPYYKAKDDAAYRYRQLLAKWREEQRKE